MSILIARHAESMQNAARVIQVPASPLSPAGCTQAQKLAERIAAIGIARIIASDLARAAETAACVGARTGVAVELDAGLRERDFGDLRGTPHAALGFDLYGPDYVPPNGESWPVFHARVKATWQRIAESVAATRGNLLIVTHALVCRSLLDHCFNPAGGQRSLEVSANTALTEVDAAPPWTVRLLNCTAHLADA